MARHGHVSLKTHRTAKSDRNRAILSAPAVPLDPLAVSASGSPHRPTAQRVIAPARLRRPAADTFARQPPSLVHPHGDGLTTSHPKHQARPTVADTGTACTPSAMTFSTRGHFGRASSKCPARIPPIDVSPKPPREPKPAGRVQGRSVCAGGAPPSGNATVASRRCRRAASSPCFGANRSATKNSAACSNTMHAPVDALMKKLR